MTDALTTPEALRGPVGASDAVSACEATAASATPKGTTVCLVPGQARARSAALLGFFVLGPPLGVALAILIEAVIA